MTLSTMGSEGLPLLLSALVLGFVGSAHCLAMCGGIAAALGQARPQAGPAAALAHATVYSAGRITSYALIGLGAGLLGEAFAISLGWTTGLRVLAGLLIVGFGLHVAGWWNGLALVEQIGRGVWRRLLPVHRRIGAPDRISKVFALGMLWGWLPCGLVYAALVGAASTGSGLSGALFMLCFGLGTLPALLAASGLGARLGGLLALRSARRTAGVLLLVFGFWSIAVATLPLHGGAHGSMHGSSHAPALSETDAQASPERRHDHPGHASRP